jgi:hypothetical protein
VSERVPQPTDVLVKRLRRVAKWHDEEALATDCDDLKARAAARANTCWQAAARLEEVVAQCQRMDAALLSVDEIRGILRKLEE